MLRPPARCFLADLVDETLQMSQCRGVRTLRQQSPFLRCELTGKAVAEPIQDEALPVIP